MVRTGPWMQRGVQAALVVSLALVVVLTWRVRQMRSAYRDLYARTIQPHVGLHVPTFSTTAIDGRPVTVGRTATGQRQLLFVFTTTCPYCLATLPAWRRLAATTSGSGLAVETIGISLDSATVTESYSRMHSLPYPVVLFPESKLQAIYRTNAVPITLLLDDNGQVLFYHLGVLNRATEDSVKALSRFIQGGIQ